jgi:acyl carrier protein
MNEQKLKNAFLVALNIDESLVNEQLLYQSIPEWDSISHMVLVSELESTFDVSLETDDVIDMSSFGKVKEILTKYGVVFI